MHALPESSSVLDMTELHPVVSGLRWILDSENRQQPSGRRWSMRALSIAAGLAPSHVEGILNGRQQPNLTLDTAQALARAGNVRTLWLLTGQGPREPFEEGSVDVPSPAPPPVSHQRVANDVVTDLLNAAWDSKEHGPADAILVGEALRSQAALLKGHVEPVDIVRALLDTSAEARRKNKPLTAEELPMVALGTTKRKLTHAEAKIAYWMNQATLDAEAMGLPIPDGPHPALLAAQKAAFGDDFVEEPEEDDAPPPKKKGGKGGR